MYESTANFNKTASQVIGSVTSVALDNSHLCTSPNNLGGDEKTPGMRIMIEGDFTKSLKQDEDNSAPDLCSFSSQKFKLTPQGAADPRMPMADSKGNSKESRNQISKSSLSSLSFKELANF